MIRTGKKQPKVEFRIALMDLHQMLSFLHAEKKKLDRVIASLEELQAIYSDSAAPGNRGRKSDSAVPQRRGRKSMSEEERREVSARMKKFWTERRKD